MNNITQRQDTRPGELGRRVFDMRGKPRFRRPPWIGYLKFRSERYYDPGIVPNTSFDHLGHPIVDNSTGAHKKEWLKVLYSAGVVTSVSYENSHPGTNPEPPNERWYKVSDHSDPIVLS